MREFAVAKRRVQVVGRSTFIVSLPKSWASRAGLSRGSYVYIEEMPDGSLRVTAERPREELGWMTRVVDARGSSLEDAVRDVISSYIAGYDSIVVLYDEEKEELSWKLVEVCGERLADLLVVSENPGMIVFSIARRQRAGNLAKLSSLMVRAILEITDELVESARKRDIEKLRSLRDRDNIVDKIYFMMTKTLSKTLSGEISLAEAGVKSYVEILHLYHAAKTLERLSDHLSSASQTLAKLFSSQKELSEEALALIEETVKIEKEMLSAFLKLDVRQAKVAAASSEALRRKLERYLAEESDADKHSIALDFYRVASYTLDIAEIVIDINSVRELLQSRARYITELSKISTSIENR